MRWIPWIVVLACAVGCRRHHPPVEPVPDVEEAPAAAKQPAVAPTRDNPLGEPVLAPSVNQPRMPDGGTINGDPRGPRAAEFNRVVDAAFPKLRDCLDRASLPAGSIRVVAHYTVEQPGYTGAVTVRGDAPAEAIACCKGVIEALKFPEFRGPKVEQDLPFTYQKTEKPTRVEIWDAALPPEKSK